MISTGISIYPIKARARDQVIRWQNMAEAAGLDPESINRIDGDVRDLTQRRYIMQRTRLALMTPDFIQQHSWPTRSPHKGSPMEAIRPVLAEDIEWFDRPSRRLSGHPCRSTHNPDVLLLFYDSVIS